MFGIIWVRNFYDFLPICSWHEMGMHDLPAEIDYVLNVTGNKELNYIGHSMGTTMFFVCLSSRPEYNRKVKFMAGMGPAVYLSHMRGPARYLAPLATAEKASDCSGDGAKIWSIFFVFHHVI